MAAPIVAGIEHIRIMYPTSDATPAMIREAWTRAVVRRMAAQRPYPWPEGEARRHVDTALDWLAMTLDFIVGAVNGWQAPGDGEE